MIISSFHTGPGRNRVLYILIMRREGVIRAYFKIDTLFTYESLHRSIPFRLRHRRTRTCFLHISPYLGPYFHPFELLLNREIGLIVHLFDIAKAFSG